MCFLKADASIIHIPFQSGVKSTGFIGVDEEEEDKEREEAEELTEETAEKLENIKEEVLVKSRNEVAKEFLDEGIQVWSNGRPCKEVQLKIGGLLLVVQANDIIDAVQRCSNLDEQ